MLDKKTGKKAEVTAIQFHPKTCSLEVLKPSGPEVSPPMNLNPTPDGGVAKVVAHLFAFDPLESVFLDTTVVVDGSRAGR